MNAQAMYDQCELVADHLHHIAGLTDMMLTAIDQPLANAPQSTQVYALLAAIDRFRSDAEQSVNLISRMTGGR